jgi:hypothetical protein
MTQMTKRNGPHPPPLPPLRPGSAASNTTVMDAIRRGGATSWVEAFGVSLYISKPEVREAAQAWLDYYGVPRSRFFTWLVIGAEKIGGEKDKSDNDSG